MRPTKYNKEILDQTREYLASVPNEEEVIPSIEGLALFLNLARSTIYDWSGQESKKEFSDIIEAILALQGRTLLNGSLRGKLNPVIAKVILSKHGYREGTDVHDESAKTQIDELRKELKDVLK